MRNHATDAAFGVFYVTFVAWDEMHVAVENGLASCFINVDADVITVGVKTLIYLLFDILQHYIHGLTLVIG